MPALVHMPCRVGAEPRYLFTDSLPVVPGEADAVAVSHAADGQRAVGMALLDLSGGREVGAGPGRERSHIRAVGGGHQGDLVGEQAGLPAVLGSLGHGLA